MESNQETEPKKSRHRKKQLYKSILQQMEFYFSDSNLTKDRFLSQLINQDPYVNLDVFLKFNKIRKLTENIEDIQKAVSKSEILQLSEDKMKICRRTPIKIREDIDDCTIYVERLKSDATHEWLSSVFSEFGKVTYVSIPRYKNNGMVKGFAFVEFEDKESVERVVQFFESIGCKMPSNMESQNLCSIVTFEGDNQIEERYKQDQKDKKDNENDKSQKRRCSDDCKDENEMLPHKKVKSDVESEQILIETKEANHEEDNEVKKQKKKKKNKNKIDIKELGLQILTKKEWKKMRNHYLDLQKKKMKELKKYLYKQRFNKPYEQNKTLQNSNKAPNEKPDKESAEENSKSKLFEFVPGVIVKVTLSEPCESTKTLKNKLKNQYPNLKYIDVPTSDSDKIFLRFSNNDEAKQFCSSGFKGECQLLQDVEEKQYWDKILNDRNNKLRKNQKQRGREKLLKKARCEKGQHIRFDDK